MTIEHQIVTDEDGNPTAALIPWEQFQVIRAEIEVDEDAPLSPEWRAELDRRMQSIKDGTATLISHDELIDRIQGTLDKCEAERSKSA